MRCKPRIILLTVPVGSCVVCGLVIEGFPKRHWHRESCLVQYKIAKEPAYARHKVWERDHGQCSMCAFQDDRLRGDWEVDHIRPLWGSAGDMAFFALDNLQTLCVEHHKQKTRCDVRDWRLAQRELTNKCTL